METITLTQFGLPTQYDAAHIVNGGTILAAVAEPEIRATRGQYPRPWTEDDENALLRAILSWMRDNLQPEDRDTACVQMDPGRDQAVDYPFIDDPKSAS